MRALPRAGLAVLTLLVLVALAGARAAAMPGPSTLSTGFVDDPAFESTGPAGEARWLGAASGLGSSWVRLTAYWSLTAPTRFPAGFQPTDPADRHYDFGWLDTSVRTAVQARQNVVLMLLSPPSWALGRGAPKRDPYASWRPSPRLLGQFARAVAQRYSGHFPDPLHPGTMLPHVSAFQAWNEPNMPGLLTPQWTRSHGAWVPASPAWYRRMLNAVYANVKAVQPGAQVLAAGTAPYGDPPGVGRMTPVVFDRELLCLHGPALRREACRNPAHFDALDHHPYALNPTIHAFLPDDVAVPDVHKLEHILAVAVGEHLVRPAGPKPMWITEIDWGSNPPDPAQKSLNVQRRYLGYALYELWRQGVAHVMWFELRDEPGFSNQFPGAGVLFASGMPKPSAQVFRFPFVAVPASGGGLVLWGRAPAPGTVTIQSGDGHGWHTLFTLPTTAGGIFYTIRGLRPHLILRAVEGTTASAGWRAVTRVNAS